MNIIIAGPARGWQEERRDHNSGMRRSDNPDMLNIESEDNKGAEMILSIHFVTGYEEGDLRARDFVTTDNYGYYREDKRAAGLHIGSYHPKRWVFRRSSEIKVVRQKRRLHTVLILIHELWHAAIWLLWLPPKWSEFAETHVFHKWWKA